MRQVRKDIDGLRWTSSTLLSHKNVAAQMDLLSHKIVESQMDLPPDLKYSRSCWLVCFKEILIVAQPIQQLHACSTYRTDLILQDGTIFCSDLNLPSQCTAGNSSKQSREEAVRSESDDITLSLSALPRSSRMLHQRRHLRWIKIY